MASTPFRLRTLGGASLESSDDRPLPGFSSQRKAIALLVLLAAARPRGLQRDKLLAYLWPESATDQARNALYNLLFRVRRVLGNDAIVGTAELSLDPTIVGSDIREFDEAVAAKSYAVAESLYSGPFLDGFYLRDAPEFERWSSDERTRLARTHLEILEYLAESGTASGDPAGAVRWWRKRTEADPLSAPGALGYINALAAVGDREGALSFMAVHREIVRAELGAEPDATLIQRVEQLRQDGHTPAARRTDGSQAFPSPPPARSENPTPPSAPRARRRLSKPVLFVGVVTGCAVLAIGFAARRAATSPLDEKRLVVAAFDNDTGDSTLDAFGRIAADEITEQLARANLVRVVDAATALAGSRRVRDTVAHLANPAGLQLLARETRAGLVVTGRYFRDGEDMVVQARVTNARENLVLAAIEPVRAPMVDRAALVNSVRERVLGALALRLDDRLKTLVPVGTTPTYEAYEAFIAGLETFTTGRLPQSAPDFERAYTLDTSFVEPLIWAAFAVGNSPKRDSIVQTLEAHRTNLSQIDRYALDYHRAFTSGTLEERLAAARNAARLAPGTHWTHNVASTLAAMGRTREAVDVWATIDRDHGWLRSWPGFWMGYIQSLHVSGMHRDELKVAQEARKALPANLTLREYEAIALVSNQRWGELEDRVRAIEQRGDAEWSLRFIASELHLHGQEARARQMEERSLRWYEERATAGTRDAGFRSDRVFALYSAGRWIDAQASIDSLRLEQPRNFQWAGLSARTHARSNQRGFATALMDSLVQNAPEHGADGQLAEAARIAAALGLRERAVVLLERSREHPANYWRHYSWNAADFDSLAGNPAFERLMAGR